MKIENTIIELQRRFDALDKFRDKIIELESRTYTYESQLGIYFKLKKLQEDYIAYIGQDPLLSGVVIQIIRDRKLSIFEISCLVHNYISTESLTLEQFNNDKTEQPPFLPEDLDEELGVSKHMARQFDLAESLLLDRQSKGSLDSLDPFTKLFTGDLGLNIALITRLHNEILERLDNKKTQGTSSPSLILNQKSIISGDGRYFPRSESLQEGILAAIVGNNKSKRNNGKYNYSIRLDYIKSMLEESSEEEISIEEIKKAITSIRRSLKDNGISNLALSVKGGVLRIIEN